MTFIVDKTVADKTVADKTIAQRSPRRALCRALFVASLAAGLAGCTDVSTEQRGHGYHTNNQDPSEGRADNFQDFESNRKTVFGDGGLSILGGNDEPSAPADGGGIGVNSYLWRASLDTISFMPVTSADPFGGVIITDWHSPEQTVDERFKLNVYILGRALRADGVRVSVFRQVQDQTGIWRDAGLPTETSVQIEDAILTRARQLRNETVYR